MGNKKHVLTVITGLTSVGFICGWIGSRIQAYRDRKSILKVMEHYESECDKIEDPEERERQRRKVNQMLSLCVRKVLWGPDSD